MSYTGNRNQRKPSSYQKRPTRYRDSYHDTNRSRRSRNQNQRLSLLIVLVFLIALVVIIRFALGRGGKTEQDPLPSSSSLPDSQGESSSESSSEPDSEPEAAIPTMKGLDTLDATAAHTTSYYTYGTHFNLNGTMDTTENIQSMQLVLHSLNNDSNVYSQELSWTTEDDGIHFLTAKLINEGVNLEALPVGDYAWLIQIHFKDGSTIYRNIIDDTDTDPIDYYTITQNGVNRRIQIDSATDTVHNRPYFAASIQEASLPDTIYDIAIDAGHGGNDGGAVGGDHTEAELTLACALDLKEDLEALGYKVFLTRDGTEDPSTPMAYTMYDEDGRVNTACASRAKFCVSLHLNSAEQEMTVGGIQVYASARGNVNLGRALAEQIKQNTNADYSNMTYNKMADGVYYNTSREYNSEDVMSNSDSLFMIRELGGIATGAYMDGSNATYGTNLYLDSPQGVECCLIELGYITVDKDLQDIVQNMDKYAQAICDALHSRAQQTTE